MGIATLEEFVEESAASSGHACAGQVLGIRLALTNTNRLQGIFMREILNPSRLSLADFKSHGH